MIGDGTVQSRGLLRDNRIGMPIKAYVFAHEFDRLFGTTQDALREISRALHRHPSALQCPESGRPYLYAVSFPWGYIEHGGPVRKVDFYGFDFDKPWGECNPEWDPYIFRDGILQPRGTKGCETGLIILGEEGKLRRRLAEYGKDLTHYTQRWPDIGRLGPLDGHIAIVGITKHRSK